MVNTHKQVAKFHTPSRFEGDTASRAIQYISADVARCQRELAETAHLINQTVADIEGYQARLEETARWLADAKKRLSSYEDSYAYWLQRVNELPYELDIYGPEIVCETRETPLPF